jgi:hypothetical protein
VNLRKSIIQRQSDKQSQLGCSSVNYAEALFFPYKMASFTYYPVPSPDLVLVDPDW